MTTVTVSRDLDRVLRALRLGQMARTLPERAVLAKQQHQSHLGFLEVVLSDEVARRDTKSASERARKAGLDRHMRLEAWEELSDITYDRTLWSDLVKLDLASTACNIIVLGPVGVGKTHLATALGHIAVRRRVATCFYRADRLFNLFKAARLDNTLEAEYRRLSTTKLLIVDDLALRAMDATATNDFYELVVGRHQRYPTIWTSNRDPAEWIGLMADTLLAQAAIDRVTAGAHVLIIDGPSYRQRGRRGQTRVVDTSGEDHHG